MFKLYEDQTRIEVQIFVTTISGFAPKLRNEIHGFFSLNRQKFEHFMVKERLA